MRISQRHLSTFFCVPDYYYPAFFALNIRISIFFEIFCRGEILSHGAFLICGGGDIELKCVCELLRTRIIDFYARVDSMFNEHIKIDCSGAQKASDEICRIKFTIWHKVVQKKMRSVWAMDMWSGGAAEEVGQQ